MENFQSRRGFHREMSKKMKRSMEDELSGCLTIFEVMGLQYFSLKSLTNKTLNERPSALRTAYMLIIFTFVIMLMVLYIITDQFAMKETMSSKNALMFVVQHSMNMGMIIVVSTTIVQAYCSTRSMKQIFLNTKQIVQLCELQEFRLELDFNRIKRETWKKFAAMVCFIATTHLTVFIANGAASGNYSILLGMIPMLFLNTTVLKFVFYVGMINSQLEFLVKLLNDVFKRKPSRIMSNINFYLVNVKPVKTPEDPMKKLRAVWNIYHVIYDNAALVNKSLGLTVLTILGCLVVAMTVSGKGLAMENLSK